MSNKPKHVVGYTVDLSAGFHRYVSVEGVGECRENFAGPVASMEHPTFEAVVVAKGEYLFVDTSPRWIEKFIATAQRNHIKVAAVDTARECDLANPQDEADFRTLREKL
ncbi:MAG TPA: hypothetical protein VGP82_00575 [Ktedonobacterales bacterium]|nr:hypothetical protein [Ktedonobacterales bacterium]